MQGQMMAFTDQAAKELATACAQRPDREIRAWLSIAQQREAMVTKLYDIGAIERRLGESVPGTLADLVRKAIGNLWVHEESHTRYISALKQDAALSGSVIETVRGRMEGLIIDSGTRGRLLGRLGIALGIATGMAPEFLREIDQMSLREFCAFCSELEQTARRGYERIIELIAVIRASDDIDPYAMSLHADITRILAEEHYHSAVFATISEWIDSDGNTLRELDTKACVRQLYDLCDRLLDAGPVQHRGEGTAAPDPAGVWVSDGGMGPLFLEYGMEVRVR
jgi:hypothetical protein